MELGACSRVLNANQPSSSSSSLYFSPTIRFQPCFSNASFQVFTAIPRRSDCCCRAIVKDSVNSISSISVEKEKVLQRYGIPKPYEKLKELTRGRSVTKESIREFIEGLELPTQAKADLLELTPHTYIGALVELAKAVDMAVNLVNGE
ncbi:hypothetical protein ACSBR1_013090 [Camellia fascicularis]